MVRTSGIREKLRSNVLKELARERSTKRPRLEANDEKDKDSQEDEETAREEQEKLVAAAARSTNNSLLSILPRPKNSDAFGPTVRLDKLLKMPERADTLVASDGKESNQESGTRIAEDGMIEVDVSKVVGDVSQSYIKELTIEKSRPSVIVPGGKEKQKNQITYLAKLGKATELERKEQAAQSRHNKAAARAKYGW